MGETAKEEVVRPTSRGLATTPTLASQASGKRNGCRSPYVRSKSPQCRSFT
jgi:hypothetical protein